MKSKMQMLLAGGALAVLLLAAVGYATAQDNETLANDPNDTADAVGGAAVKDPAKCPKGAHGDDGAWEGDDDAVKEVASAA